MSAGVGAQQISILMSIGLNYSTAGCGDTDFQRLGILVSITRGPGPSLCIAP